MFYFITGDLLQSDAEALVNPVNCQGCMGKGLALQFRRRFPEMYADYVEACRAGRLTPGRLHCYRTGRQFIINFPTKNKWRAKSKPEYISAGLDELVKTIRTEQLRSIAIPALGSGNGGLDWEEVRNLILAKLEPVADTTEIFIYSPDLN